MATRATPANMKHFSLVNGVIAFSPTTGEEYSASSGDYWDLQRHSALRDLNGEEMILVVKQCTFVDVLNINSKQNASYLGKHRKIEQKEEI